MQLFERTLGEWLEYWAEEAPDRDYIVYPDRNLRFIWSRFNQRVDDMAKGLIAISVGRGTHVGIWAANVPDWLTLLSSRCEGCAGGGHPLEVIWRGGRRIHHPKRGDTDTGSGCTRLL